MAQGVTYYWDVNGTTAGFNTVVGGWNGTNTFWNTDITGGNGGSITATTLNTDDLIIGQATTNTGTITVTGSRVANSITFSSTVGAVTISGGTGLTLGDGTAGNGGITLSGGSANQAITTAITLNNSQTWTNNSTGTLTTGSIVAGTNTLTLAGTGNYAFAASSTFTGTTAAITFSGSGTYDLRNLTAPTTSGTWTVSGGGRLYGANYGTAQNITVSNGYIETYFGETFNRAIGTGVNQVQFTGGISGLSENGNGNTFNLGGAGATLQWGTATFNPTQFILGASTMQGNSTRNTSLTLTNGIDLNGDTRTIRQDQIDGANGTGTAQRVTPGSTINGNIIGTGGGSLTKEGVGRLTLTGTNTYSGGTTINAGTLRFSNLISMPASGTVSVNTGGTIGISVGSAGQWTTGTSGVGTVGGLLSGLGGQGSSTVSYSGTVGVELINATNQTYTGNIANVGTTLNFIKSGAGILTLSGTNTYTGITRVFAGTLQFANTASLYNSNTASWTAANLNAQTGSTLAFNVGGTGEFSTSDITTLLTNLASASSLSNGMNAGSNFGFDTTNASGGTFTINDVIANSTGTHGGARGLTKLGTGILELSGTNTYTGTTTISGGTLIASGGAAIANAGLVTLANTAGVTFQLNNSETIGNLSGGGTTGGTVALGANTLTVGDGNNQTYSGIFTGTGGIIKQGAGTLTLAGTNLGVTATINAGMLAFNSTTTVSGSTITLGANGSGVLFNGVASAGVSGTGGVTISNNIVLGNSVTTTGTRLWATGNAGRFNFTGTITGAAGAAGAQTLLFDTRGGAGTGGDRHTTTISGVIADGNQPLNLSFAITPQSASSGTNNHPTYVNLTAANTFTGNITATRGNAGATSWLVIGGERWSDGTNNTPTYGRMGSGYLGVGGVYAGNFALGGTAGNIVNLSYFSSANQTWSGTIGTGGVNNNGALVKEGTGTLTLTGASTYNSLTTIGGGTLLLGFDTTTTNILPSTTALWMGLGTIYDPITANADMTISGGGTGGTLELAGAAAGLSTQTVASLNTAAYTANRIVMGANRTLTITSSTVTIGTGSSLNFNTAAGGNNGATVGTSIIAFGGVPSAFTPGFTVTDAGGFGLATVNGSNQVIRDTSTALLPDTGATSATDYRIDNNGGTSSTPGSSTLTVSSSQSARSITVDTIAANGILTLNSGVVLSNNIWNFGGSSNTYNITGSAGGAGLRSVASNDAISINNYNGGTITIDSPILANGTNAFSVGGGTGAVILNGVNTFTGTTTISSGNLEIGGSGSLNSGSYAGAINIATGSTFRFSSSAAQTLSGAIAGGGALTKDTGTGTLILSGTNPFSGVTTISSGTLQLGAAGTTGSLTGTSSIVNNGTLTIRRSNAFTQATDLGGAVISGSGGVNINNTANTVTLNGNNTYLGTTTLTSATLQAASLNALGNGGDITFAGGTLQYTAASAANDYGSRIKNSASAMILDTNGQSTTLTGIANTNTAGLTKSGAGTLTLVNANYTGNTAVNGGSLVVNGGTISGGTLALNAASMSIINGATVTTTSGGSASTFVSNTSMTITGGNGVTSTWNAGGGDLGSPNNNYSNAQMVIDGAGYAGSARVINIANLIWGRSLANSTLTLTNGGQMNVNGEIRIGNTYYNQTGNSDIIIGGVGDTATSTLTGSGGNLYIGHSLSGSDRNNVKDNDVTVNSNGVLTGIGSVYVGTLGYTVSQGNSTNNKLTVSGTGTASITNFIVGYSTVSVDAANANVVQVTAGGTLTTSSGTNYVGYANAAGAVASSNTATVTGTDSTWNAGNQNVIIGFANNATATSNNNILTVSSGGVLSNVATLTVGSGTGTRTGNKVVLDGGSITATTVSVSASNTLEIGVNGGSLSGNIANNGALNIGSNVAFSVAGNISGTTGTITQSGSGTTILSGTNSFTGNTVVSAGTLQFAKMVSLNNNVDTNWTAAKINVKSGATLALNVDSAGTNGFTDAKLNTLFTNISVANTATEGLQAGAILGFDTSTATGGTFTQGNAIADSTGSGAFHGAIGLTKLGTGTLILDKTNTYTGATLVSAGTLLVSGSLVSDVTVSDGAMIAGGGTVDDLILGGGSLFDIFLAVDSSDSLAATNISFAATGFGIDNLRANGSAVDWGTVSDGVYTLITGTLNSTNLENFGSGNAYDIGGGRSAYFQEGSLQLVVQTIPEPKTALLGVLGVLLLLRRRR